MSVRFVRRRSISAPGEAFMRLRTSVLPLLGPALFRGAAIACLLLVAAAALPGRAAADETEVIEQVLKFLRCVSAPGFPMMGTFCTWH